MQRTPVIILSLMLLLVISGITFSGVFAFTTTDVLYSCDSPNSSGLIHKLNKADGTIISSNPMVITGLPAPVKGCNGLAQDPTTGTFYSIIQYQGQATTTASLPLCS